VFALIITLLLVTAAAAVLVRLRQQRGFFLHQRMHNIEITNPMFGEFDGDVGGLEVASLASIPSQTTNFTNPMYEFQGAEEEREVLVSHPLA